MNRFILVVALAAACSSPALAGSGKVRANHAYNAYPTPSWVLPLPRSERLADGTVAIPPILIGTHASRIREIGALALAAATINSPSLSSIKKGSPQR
jgi:hypothetical protein